MRIGIVAGEASGDLLGSGLIAELRKLHAGLEFEGIAGPFMQRAGAHTLYPMDKLSVMGITEVLGRYIELRRMQKQLIRHFRNIKIDLFIGVDAPDFNLEIEYQLRKSGIKTIHYVSPSVWAWRKYRIRKIAKSVDLMLTLFPFEASFYQQHNVPVKFVGHPLADIVPKQVDRKQARHLLGLPLEKKIIALLPGSRSSELQYHCDPFLKVAAWCNKNAANLHFVVPFANPQRRQQFENSYNNLGESLPLTMFDGMSREVMTASDVVLLASGTAALEALLLKRPMVVAHRVSAVTYWIAKRLVSLTHYSLPNLLLPQPLIPEFIQHEIVIDKIGEQLLKYLNDKELVASLVAKFESIHLQLQKNASLQAASAVMALLEQPE